MTHFRTTDPHAPGPEALPDELRAALEHAQQLSDSRPEGGYTSRWSHAAWHVGDLSVLALDSPLRRSR
jgi:hypothetical protein